MKTLAKAGGEGGSRVDFETQTATGRNFWLLVILSLSTLLSSLSTSITNVALPTLSEAFRASFQSVQWVTLSYLLTITSLIVGVGRLGDLIGRKRLLLIGVALFALASGLCAMASSLWVLIAARALQGVGAAIMMALTMSIVSDAVEKTKIGSAMGLLGTMSALGTALGPSLGGFLIASSGWSAIFFIMVPPAIFVLLAGLRKLPSDSSSISDGSAHFDRIGTILLALTLAAYALSMTLGRGDFGAVNVAFFIAAILGVMAFTITQKKVASPLVQLSIFRNHALNAGLVTSVLVTTIVMATLVVGPFFLAGALKLGASSVGLCMSVGPIVAALTGVPAGRAVDRYGAHRITVGGLIGMVVGSVSMAYAPAIFGVIGYVAPLMMMTAGYALFQAANNKAVMTQATADQRGVISALLNLSRNLGLITGAAAMGALFAVVAGSDIALASPQDLENGLRVTFITAAGLALAALMTAVASQHMPRQSDL